MADETAQEHHDPFGNGAIADAIGGPLGVVESALPAAAFVAANTIADDATLAAGVALAIGVLMTLARLARGQTPRYALSGLFGVALAAFVVARTGKAENFFLPGLLANAGYAIACIVSNLVGRPLIELIIRGLTAASEEKPPPPSEALRAAYRRATWMWAGLFSLRIAVQVPLYLADALVALGAAKVAMGLPLYALGLWVTFLLVRTAIGPSSPPPQPA